MTLLDLFSEGRMASPYTASFFEPINLPVDQLEINLHSQYRIADRRLLIQDLQMMLDLS